MCKDVTEVISTMTALYYMVNVREENGTYNTFDGNSMEYFSTKPEGFEKGAGIIVISEIWGLTEFIKNVCRRLSAEGYSAIAPNLYSRPDEKILYTEENMMDAMRPIWSIPSEKRRDPSAIQDILSTVNDTSGKIITSIMVEREHIEKRMIKDLESLYNFYFDKKNTAKGIVGFCMGGGLAFQLSTQEEFEASVIFYGRNPLNIKDVRRIKGAVLALYAGEDGTINSGIPDLLEQVVEHKTDFEMKLYPGTFHAFFNDSGMSYHEEAAKDAWEKTTTFYKKYLKSE